jgi:hypothetical protein
MEMTPEQWERVNDGCATLAQGGGEFTPKGFNSVGKIKAGAIIAISYGYDPFLAMQHMQIVEGKVGFLYYWYLGEAVRQIPTLRYIPTEHTLERIVGTWQRSPEHPVYQVEYTIERAKLAGKVKPGSGWTTNPMEMLMSKWVLRGLQLTCPDLRLGPLASVDELDEDPPGEREPSGAVVVETPANVAAAALGVDAGGEESTRTNGGPDGESKPPAQTQPVPNVEELTAKQLATAFKVQAKSLGFDVRSGEKLRDLLVTLLTVNGAAPVITNPSEVTRADWLAATKRLQREYPNGKNSKLNGAEGGGTELTGSGTLDVPPPAEDPVEADAPAEEPTATEEEMRAAQLRDPEYLEQLGLSLEKLWKLPGTIIKEAQGAKWFAGSAVLLSCGFKTTDGKAKAMCIIGETKYEDRRLTPEQVSMLAQATVAEIDKAKNGGRPVVAQTTAGAR